MEYVKNGTVADVTPPPPPFNVRVTSKGSGGNEITWDAEADFESGIGGFFVMRDNRALVRLPKHDRTGLVVYGRPLFQGLSYHDTPEGPPAAPEMRYVDVSAKPGEKHTYSILTINSAGVRIRAIRRGCHSFCRIRKGVRIMNSGLKLFFAARPSFGLPATPRQRTCTSPSKARKPLGTRFDRYDFIMDDATGAITPMTAPASEVTSFGIDVTLKDGKRRGVVVVPKKAAPGNPWSWQACYWNHQPQTEVELLRRGFHIAFVAPDPADRARRGTGGTSS